MHYSRRKELRWHMMWKDNLVLHKSKSCFNFFVQVLAFTKSLLLMYQLISMSRYNQFSPSMGSSDTWSDNHGNKLFFMCTPLK